MSTRLHKKSKEKLKQKAQHEPLPCQCYHMSYSAFIPTCVKLTCHTTIYPDSGSRTPPFVADFNAVFLEATSSSHELTNKARLNRYDILWQKRGGVHSYYKSTKSFNESAHNFASCKARLVIRYDQRSDGIVRVNVEEQNINEMDIIKWTFE